MSELFIDSLYSILRTDDPNVIKQMIKSNRPIIREFFKNKKQQGNIITDKHLREQLLSVIAEYNPELYLELI